MSVALDSWMAAECVRTPRIWGGARALLNSFNRWRRAHRLGEIGPREFVELLGDHGLKPVKATGIVMVPGLGLREDWNIYARK